MGIPHILLVMLISLAFGRGFLGVVAGVSLSHWPSLARLVRGEVLQLRQAPYLLAAEKLGVSRRRLVRRHLLPHLLPQFLTGLILQFPHAILHEASVTFLGFGLSSEQPAIGVILSESMQLPHHRPVVAGPVPRPGPGGGGAAVRRPGGAGAPAAGPLQRPVGADLCVRPNPGKEASMEPLLQVEHLSISFTQYDRGTRRRSLPVIRDLSLAIRPGQVTAVVGSSGSGKSLLAHGILGILPYNARWRGPSL